jgi:hypothetical protein
MATTAHTLLNLETNATDAMDLHSEPELDFDDGDIELDLEPAAPGQRQDDDVSIKDAGTDAVLETDTGTADRDDFMLDDEDFIEEDQVQYGNEVTATPTLSSNTVSMQEHAPTPVEEDLIDYSDDEEDQPLNYQHASANSVATEAQDTQEQHSDVHTEQAQEEVLASGLSNSNDMTTYGEHVQDGDQGDAGNEPNHQEQLHADEFQAHNETDSQTDVDDGGVLLHDSEVLTNDSVHDLDTHEEQRFIETRPITVNYEGNELWLFKQHDSDDSGDWLLEDIQVLHSSISVLFQACRASLGESISTETELGLRFDHFHNMEIFEDSTACVAVSLERLVDLYHTLNAQDGDSDPESFYMCLLSRPRFATLLSDVAKYAEQGNGYSGLNSAVAAGETHFADVYSGHSTEHDTTEWESGKVADEEYHEDTETPSEAEHAIEYAEHEEQDGDDPRSGNEESTQANTRAQHDTDATSGEVEENPTVITVTDHDEDLAQHDDDNEVSSAHEVQLENDTVDYSDVDEPDNDEDKPQIELLHGPSPSSTTVQGDHLTGEDTLPIAGDTNHEGHLSVENDDNIQTEEQTGVEDNIESYQDDNHTYDEEDPFQGLHVDATQTQPTEPDFEDFTNQYDAGYDYQDLDQKLEKDLLSGADLSGTGAGESTLTANDFADGDDFLDLDNASEWVVDQEPTLKVPEVDELVDDEFTFQDEKEEDGVVTQPAVAASTAADPVATSSVDLQEASPQGKKRSIDEVGDSTGDALDFSGKFWVPEICAHYVDADIVFADIKRPRV